MVAWHVKPGDLVHEDQVMCEVMTEKAAVEMPAPVTGLNAQFELGAGANYRGGPERGALDNYGTGIFSYADARR